MFFRKFPRFSGYSRPSSSTIRSALWENAHRSLAALGVLLATAGGALLPTSVLSCSPRWPQEELLWKKPASSWPLKQGPKKWSKHGCDKGTLTVWPNQEHQPHQRVCLLIGNFKVEPKDSVESGERNSPEEIEGEVEPDAKRPKVGIENRMQELMSKVEEGYALTGQALRSV